MYACTHTYTDALQCMHGLIGTSICTWHTRIDPSVSRYVCSRNTILSDYPTIWPKEKYSVKKDEIYDLTPDL